MISLEEAKVRLFASAKLLEPERVPLLNALGRISAADLDSKIDLPAFDNSAMDGYAVRTEDLKNASESNPVDLKLVGRIGAGEKFGGVISPGNCLRIFTGSVLPDGADAVVMQEDTWAENGRVRFVEGVRPLENVRLCGEDIRSGTRVLETGDRITSTRLSLLAATGHAQILVRKLPKIALIATGDELAEPGETLPYGKIYESNRILLSGLLQSLGVTADIRPLTRDTLETTIQSLHGAFEENDVVITTGGVSVGEFDFVKEAFTKIGGRIDHWKVAIRPGKPFVFGEFASKFLFGLPGNPVSALVTFLTLVRPALLQMMGARNVDLPIARGFLAGTIFNAGDRRHFVRCRWEDGKVFAQGKQASHLIGALGSANCLVDVPPATRLEDGTSVICQLWELPGA